MSDLVLANVVGSLEWVERSGGRLTMGERIAILLGALAGLRDGFAMRRRAKKSDRPMPPLAELEPPETPMVTAARAYLGKHAEPAMANHSFRTAFWTLRVLGLDGELTPVERETAWVAALLHDVGLDVPPARGDFTLGGVEVLKTLALELGWPDEQVHLASEAITSNLGTHVDRRLGRVAWAMNVGGIGELGFGPHRGMMPKQTIAELETRFPRDGFRASALRLIAAETARVPGGRFALFRPVFWLIMR